MRYNKVRKMDISNGPGVRVSVFFQGCHFHCKNCFNPETWNFAKGKEYTSEIKDKIINLCENDYIVGLSILGGEPLHPLNIESTTQLAKEFKTKFPNKNIWCWTGYIYEKDLIGKEIFKYIDVLIDGQFVHKLFNPNLKWRGSSNQRVIDIKKTLKENKVIIIEDTEF